MTKTTDEMFYLRGSTKIPEGLPPRLKSFSTRRRRLGNVSDGFCNMITSFDRVVARGSILLEKGVTEVVVRGRKRKDLTDNVIWEVSLDKGDVPIPIGEEQVRDMGKVIWEGNGENMKVRNPMVIKNVSCSTITNSFTEANF
uniref:Uncharacterized protein n=1 Tax=Cannabis sativa TaxID=3483 RepID=A0A803PU97_CANSA